jgi:hypothetical protein
MFTKRIKCLCGYEFTHTHHADAHQVIDFTEMKPAAVDEINYHRRNVAYGVPTIQVEEDYSEVQEVAEVLDVTCPSCSTVLPIQFHFDVGAGCEIEIPKRLQDRIAPLYVPPAPQIRFENQRHPVQPVVKNFVYNAQLSRANGRATLQCTNTKEIKYL